MNNKTITIDIPKGKIPVWTELNGMTLLMLEDEIDNRPVTERIKTFNDAKKELGDSHPLVKEYNIMSGFDDTDTIVYLKLKIITAALNEGWVRTQYDTVVYYPYFYLCSEREADENGYEKLWVWGGSSSNGAPCGLACSASNLVWSPSDAFISARLVYKTKELAAYSFTQFNDLWAKYLLLNPVKYEE